MKPLRNRLSQRLTDVNFSRALATLNREVLDVNIAHLVEGITGGTCLRRWNRGNTESKWDRNSRFDPNGQDPNCGVSNVLRQAV